MVSLPRRDSFICFGANGFTTAAVGKTPPRVLQFGWRPNAFLLRGTISIPPHFVAAVEGKRATRAHSHVTRMYMPLEPQTYKPSLAMSKPPLNLHWISGRSESIPSSVLRQNRKSWRRIFIHAREPLRFSKKKRETYYRGGRAVPPSVSAAHTDAPDTGIFAATISTSSNLDAAPHSHEASKKAITSRTRDVAPAPHPVILEAAARRASSSRFDARSADEGRSPYSALTAKQTGEKIFDERLNTCYSDTGIRGLPGSSPHRRHTAPKNLLHSKWRFETSIPPAIGPGTGKEPTRAC